MGGQNWTPITPPEGSIFHAETQPEEDQDIQIVGTLSEMVSTAYKELTSRGGAVIALDVKHDPDVFALGIPEGYKGSLPLWQFILEPNFDLRARGFEVVQGAPSNGSAATDSVLGGLQQNGGDSDQ